MNTHNVDALYYGGFQSYGVKPISTTKPGTRDYYQKNAYKDISDYNKRKTEYFEDKVRWNTVYDKDILKSIRESDYVTKCKSTKENINKYEYSQDKFLQSIANEGRKKNEDKIREK